MEEHDIIILKEHTDGISAKSKGTIIFVYSKDIYDVEFLNNGNNKVLILNKDQIIKERC